MASGAEEAQVNGLCAVRGAAVAVWAQATVVRPEVTSTPAALVLQTDRQRGSDDAVTGAMSLQRPSDV